MKAIEDSGKSDLAVQLVAAACRDKFPLEREEASLPSGSYYYVSPFAKCVEVLVDQSGELALFTGFCSEESKFETTVSGDGVTLTCLNHEWEKANIVYDAQLEPEGVRLRGPDGAEFLMHSTRAACERDITEEDIAQALARKEAALSEAFRKLAERSQAEAKERRRQEEAQRTRRLSELKQCCDCLGGAACLSWPDDTGSQELCVEHVLWSDYTVIRFSCLREECASECPMLPSDWVDGFLS